MTPFPHTARGAPEEKSAGGGTTCSEADTSAGGARVLVGVAEGVRPGDREEVGEGGGGRDWEAGGAPD
jgi:hypothetical protein